MKLTIDAFKKQVETYQVQMESIAQQYSVRTEEFVSVKEEFIVLDKVVKKPRIKFEEVIEIIPYTIRIDQNKYMEELEERVK